MIAKEPIPLITVKPAFSWQSYSSAEDAVIAGENDRRETMDRPEVLVARGALIDAIRWSEAQLAISFENKHEIFLTATAQGICLSDEYGFSQVNGTSDSVLLCFESFPQPILWERTEILRTLRGKVFCGLQISGGTGFVYTKGNVPLMLSTLEIVNNDSQRYLLYWDSAD